VPLRGAGREAAARGERRGGGPPRDQRSARPAADPASRRGHRAPPPRAGGAAHPHAAPDGLSSALLDLLSSCRSQARSTSLSSARSAVLLPLAGSQHVAQLLTITRAAPGEHAVQRRRGSRRTIPAMSRAWPTV